jgi:hypothetical protein
VQHLLSTQLPEEQPLPAVQAAPAFAAAGCFSSSLVSAAGFFSSSLVSAAGFFSSSLVSVFLGDGHVTLDSVNSDFVASSFQTPSLQRIDSSGC